MTREEKEWEKLLEIHKQNLIQLRPKIDYSNQETRYALLNLESSISRMEFYFFHFCLRPKKKTIRLEILTHLKQANFNARIYHEKCIKLL
jgi:hypothetical protein